MRTSAKKGKWGKDHIWFYSNILIKVNCESKKKFCILPAPISYLPIWNKHLDKYLNFANNQFLDLKLVGI